MHAHTCSISHPFILIIFFLLSKIFVQNYVSALQKRVQPGYGPPSELSTKTNSHERNTLNSDRTLFTNIPADLDLDKMDLSGGPHHHHHHGCE